MRAVAVAPVMMSPRAAAAILVLALALPQIGFAAGCGAMICCQPSGDRLSFDSPDCCTPELRAEQHETPGQLTNAATTQPLVPLALAQDDTPRHATGMSPAWRTPGRDGMPPPPLHQRLSALSVFRI
jgi:hypothetical protein